MSNRGGNRGVPFSVRPKTSSLKKTHTHTHTQDTTRSKGNTPKKGFDVASPGALKCPSWGAEMLECKHCARAAISLTDSGEPDQSVAKEPLSSALLQDYEADI